MPTCWTRRRRLRHAAKSPQSRWKADLRTMRGPMRFVYFTHSLVSDWNHGNAHFLRGIVRELTPRGHDVRLFEPRDNWSLQNLIADQGPEAVARFATTFPGLRSTTYDLTTLDLDRALDGADVVIVHEWNDHNLV